MRSDIGEHQQLLKQMAMGKNGLKWLRNYSYTKTLCSSWINDF